MSIDLPKLRISKFYLDHDNGEPCVRKDNSPLTVFRLNTSSLFHGLPSVVIKQKYMGFTHSSEYSFFRNVRDTLRKEWCEKNNYNYISQIIAHQRSDVVQKRKTLQQQIKWAKEEKKDITNLQLQLEEVVTDPEEFVRARKAYHGMANAALRYTNRVIKASLVVVDPRILKLVRRFSPAHRNSIFRLASEHERLLQFIEAYPVLGLLIATNSLHFTAADVKLEIIKGAKIKEVCEVAGFPISFRKIKPQCAGFFILFKNDFINLDMRYKNVFRHLIPTKTMQQYRWMALLSDQCYRLTSLEQKSSWLNWLANVSLKEKDGKILVSHPIGSLKQDFGLFYDAFIEDPWPISVDFNGAMRRQQEWHLRENERRQRLLEEHDLMRKAERNKPFPDPFLPGYAKDGWEVVPLRSLKELEDEACTMHHCVDSYDVVVRSGSSYIYSIRKDEKKKATLELSNDNQIRQLRGPCNKNPGEDVFKFVRSWIRNMVLNQMPEKLAV